MIFFPAPALSANVGSAPPEDADPELATEEAGDEAAPDEAAELMAADVIAADVMAADVIAADVMAGDVMAADFMAADVAGADPLDDADPELLAAVPELLLQAARVRAVAAATAVATTRVLAFMGFSLMGVDEQGRTSAGGAGPKQCGERGGSGSDAD